MSDWLIPDWPAPAGVKACVTTRAGGVSLAPSTSTSTCPNSRIRSIRPPLRACARLPGGATDRADRRHSNRMYSGCGFSRSTSLAVISRLPVFTSSA